jgi:hypothetical protein
VANDFVTRGTGEQAQEPSQSQSQAFAGSGY